MIYYKNSSGILYQGHVLDILKTLKSESIQTCITSPPYWGLRKYGNIEPQLWPDGWMGHLGLEPTPDLYIKHLTVIFEEVKRILKNNGTFWLNLGDSYMSEGAWGGCYTKGFNKEKDGLEHRKLRHKQLLESLKAGYKTKNLIGIPWRTALKLQSLGWYLRSDIIWNKPNPMPESVTDRPTKSHEYIFLMSKNGERNGYYYNNVSIKENNGKRNKRSVWTINTKSIKGHTATFPHKLVELCLLAGSLKGSTVLDTLPVVHLFCRPCSLWYNLIKGVARPDLFTPAGPLGLLAPFSK